MVVPVMIGIVLGPLLALALALASFLISARLFYSMWILGYVLVLAATLLGAVAGWAIGGYGPSALALRLPPEDRGRHVGAAVALVSLFGCILLVVGRLVFNLNREFFATHIADLLLALFR